MRRAGRRCTRRGWLPVLQATGNGWRRRRVLAALVGSLGSAAAPPSAFAGPFINFLSDILPIKEAQKEAAKFDFAIRDNATTFLEVVSEKKPRTPDVPDALGAEGVVFAAADTAAQAAGVDVSQVTIRASELESTEARRMRGRVAAGLFETELLGSLTAHMVSQPEAPAFRAYCRWRAYEEALLAMGKPEAAIARFRTEFGRRLLEPNGFLASAAPLPERPRLRVNPKDTEAVVAGLNQLLKACVAAQLCTMARLEADEVLVDTWGAGGAQSLVLPIFIEGDPLVDAELLLSEEFASQTRPDPILSVIGSWIGDGEGSVTTELQHFYVNSRARSKSEVQAMTYTPKERDIQVVLRRI